jgi:hypothetical protein
LKSCAYVAAFCLTLALMRRRDRLNTIAIVIVIGLATSRHATRSTVIGVDMAGYSPTCFNTVSMMFG